MPHFSIWGLVPNLVLLLVVVWNILEKSVNKLGLYQAVIAGLYLDIFSNRLIGFNILILLCLAILIKIFLRKYVRIPFFEE